MQRLSFEQAKGPVDVAKALVSSAVAPAAAAGFIREGDATGPVVGGFFSPGLGAPAAADGPERVFFDLASLTKPLFAVALAKSAVDRRTPLAELLTEAVGTRSASVSLERLLSHRAGLEANLPVFQWLREARDEPTRLATRRSALERAADARRPGLDGPIPDEGFPPLYSDLGYMLVGEAVARALGKVDAGAVIEDLLVSALGLESELGTARGLERQGVRLGTRAAPTEDVDWRGGVIRGAVHDENAWMLTGSGGSGHAGMFGTAAAVLRFAQFVLEHRAGFPWTTARRPGGSLRAGFDGKSPEGSSAGERMGNDAFGHLGFTGTSLWIDPTLGVAVTVLSNRVHPSRESTLIRSARPLAHDALVRLALEGAP